jgi:GWxTD domain-containing protein
MFWKIFKQEITSRTNQNHLDGETGFGAFLLLPLRDRYLRLRRSRVGQGYGFVTCVILSLLLSTPILAEGQNKADSLFYVASETLNDGHLQNSIKAFKRVLQADGRYAPAHEQIARLHLQEDTPDSRRLAEFAARQAINHDPNNPMYQLLLGDVMLFRGFRHNAGKHYDEILAKFPNSAEVALNAGRNALLEFMMTKDRGVIMGRGATQEFTEKAWDRATLLLDKSLTLGPMVRDGYYLLGLAHLEYNKPVRLMQAMGRLLKRFPEDKDALLFMALAFQERGQINRANALYEEALKRMTFAERDMMENVDVIASEEERLVLASHVSSSDIWEDTPEHRKFWIQRDPLLLTDSNERRLEHYKRVSYANLRFSVPSRNEAGWQTVRGQTYIKFGRYLHRSASAQLLFSEIWFYEGFQFTFNSVNGLDKWGFAGDVGMSSTPDLLPDTPFSWEMGNGRSAFDEDPEILGIAGLEQRVNHNTKVNSSIFVMRDKEAFVKQPPRFIDPFIKQKYSLPHLTAAFREKDSVRVELAYAVPMAKLEYGDSVRLDDGLFVFDSGWNDVYRGVYRVENKVRGSLTHLVQKRTLRFPYGDYHLIAEVGDRLGGSVGTFREEGRWAVVDTGLVMSDLLLASEIKTANGFPERREDLTITPNPLRTFSRGKSAFVYLELYDLAQDGFGRTKYEISYRVGMPNKEEVNPALFDAISMDAFQGRLDVIREEVEDTDWGDLSGPNVTVHYVVPERNRLSASLEQLRQKGQQGGMVISPF